jgi:hypothetical protein
MISEEQKGHLPGLTAGYLLARAVGVSPYPLFHSFLSCVGGRNERLLKLSVSQASSRFVVNQIRRPCSVRAIFWSHNGFFEFDFPNSRKKAKRVTTIHVTVQVYANCVLASTPGCLLRFPKWKDLARRTSDMAFDGSRKEGERRCLSIFKVAKNTYAYLNLCAVSSFSLIKDRVLALSVAADE